MINIVAMISLKAIVFNELAQLNWFFDIFFIFSSLLIASSRQCHLMVEYVIEHGQHEYIWLWTNGACFTPYWVLVIFKKPMGNNGLNWQRLGTEKSEPERRADGDS